MSDTWLKRCWAEIDLRVLGQNYAVCRRRFAPAQEIMAVVKANAYGHGDIEVARYLQREMGTAHFAVSNLTEAIGLRRAGITGQILILGYTPVQKAAELAEYDITQALISEEYARELAQVPIRLKAQVALNTGMNRIGLDAADPAACERLIRRYHEQFELTGVFTHLCVADTDDPDAVAFTAGQLARFAEVERRVADLRLPYMHSLNSAGGLWHNAPTGDLVRLGIVMYGLKPDDTNILPQGIAPAMSWKTVISMIHEIRPGDSVGYGRSFTADRLMRIATLPTGYADGYRRGLAGKGYVLIRGRRAPLVGRVCMDQFMVDVSDIPDAAAGDVVTLLGSDGGETLTADDMARMLGTIGYEVICGISDRVERIYIR